MSKWRKAALEKIPSRKDVITDSDVDSIGMFWVELDVVFHEAYNPKLKNEKLIEEIWNYAEWCLKESNDADIQTVVITHFYEDLLNNKEVREELPKYLSKDDFLSLKEVFLYHNSEEKLAEYTKEYLNNWDKYSKARLKG